MARKVFFSFHFANDHWRAGQVRSMGSIEGTSELSDNDWEAVKRKGDKAISDWIDGQLNNTSCAIVLVGAQTAGRKWINYEIEQAWSRKKGLFGIRINGLLDSASQTSSAGTSPFAGYTVGPQKTPLTNLVTLHTPAGRTSQEIYRSIRDNIDGWVEAAIASRK